MNGLCDCDISNVLKKKFPKSKLRWRSYKEFSLETCDKYLKKHKANLPTLIVYKIDHHLLAEPGYHCAIVVGYRKWELILLDSLALRNGYPFNAYLTGDKSNWGDYLVYGAPYTIKPDSFRILTGLPRISLKYE